MGAVVVLVATIATVLLAIAVFTGVQDVFPGRPGGGPAIGAVVQPKSPGWSGAQPEHGVDLSFPQCGRRFTDMPSGFVIVGLDGGMPDRPNPCFASQWRFAARQDGAAVYVNTADPGRGDADEVGRAMGRADVQALSAAGVEPGTPVWLDVELPSVWKGSQARHRGVITAHLRTLAKSGYPVGIYSAPSLWAEITGDADPGVPVWVGLGRTTADTAQRACGRAAFGGASPQLVQRIATASDGGPLDRNLVCSGVSLDGLVRPN